MGDGYSTSLCRTLGGGSIKARERNLPGGRLLISFVCSGWARGHAGEQAHGGSETPCARPASCAAIPLSSFATLFRPVPGARRHSLRVSAASHLLRNESHTVSIGTQYRFLRRFDVTTGSCDFVCSTCDFACGKTWVVAYSGRITVRPEAVSSTYRAMPLWLSALQFICHEPTDGGVILVYLPSFGQTCGSITVDLRCGQTNATQSLTCLTLNAFVAIC